MKCRLAGLGHLLASRFVQLVILIGLSASETAGAQPFSQADLRPCELLADSSDAANPNTVWIGFVSDFTNRPIRRLAGDLARREIDSAGKGLPPTRLKGARRPLGLIACNSTEGIDPIFERLIYKLKVPAVIGPDKSAEALHALLNYTIPAGVVVVGNNTTAAEFTTLPTKGLFFRLLASDASQARVEALFIGTYLEPLLKAEGVITPRDAMQLVILHRGDAYGRGIARILMRHLRFNGRSPGDNRAHFKRIEYGSADDSASTRQPLNYESIAAEIVDMRPHVIAFAGTTEMLEIVKAVETTWPATVSYRPIWIGTDGAGVVSARYVSLDSTFLRRLLATNLKVDFDRPTARHVLTAIGREHPEIFQKDPRSVTAVATYDAVYALAYAIASLGGAPLTGSNIAAALRRLNQRGGAEAEVGPRDIQMIFTRLERREPIDLRGTTGDLNWDVNGDVTQEIEILCPRTTSNRTGVTQMIGMKSSGLYYDVGHATFRGRMADCPRRVEARNARILFDSQPMQR